MEYSEKNKTKHRSKELDNYTCQVCGVQGCKKCGYIESHHILHRESGGLDISNNLVTICSNHHRALHNHNIVPDGKDPSEYTQELMNDVEKRPIITPEPEPDHRQRLEALKKSNMPDEIKKAQIEYITNKKN